MNRKSVLLGLAAAAVACASPLTATASTNTFAVPSFRGTAGSTFDGWESFKVGIGGEGNAGDLPTSSGNARLYQTAAGALVIGSGNIYNGEAASKFEVRYSNPSVITDVVFQARTLGTELNYGSVRLVAWSSVLPGTRVELERLAFGPPPPNPGSGVAVTSQWTWDLRGLSANNFAIAYDAAEINLSMDSATLDVRTVPEPGPLALGLAGMATLWALGRRQPARRA